MSHHPHHPYIRCISSSFTIPNHQNVEETNKTGCLKTHSWARHRPSQTPWNKITEPHSWKVWLRWKSLNVGSYFKLRDSDLHHASSLLHSVTCNKAKKKKKVHSRNWRVGICKSNHTTSAEAGKWNHHTNCSDTCMREYPESLWASATAQDRVCSQTHNITLLICSLEKPSEPLFSFALNCRIQVETFFGDGTLSILVKWSQLLSSLPLNAHYASSEGSLDQRDWRGLLADDFWPPQKNHPKAPGCNQQFSVSRCKLSCGWNATLDSGMTFLGLERRWKVMIWFAGGGVDQHPRVTT